nr:hypothetical protein [Tanacetum cinerariifolium]
MWMLYSRVKNNSGEVVMVTREEVGIILERQEKEMADQASMDVFEFMMKEAWYEPDHSLYGLDVNVWEEK